MRIRRLLREIALAGLLASLAVVALFVASLGWLIGVQARDSSVCVQGGCLWVTPVRLDDRVVAAWTGTGPNNVAYWSFHPDWLAFPLYVVFLAFAVPTVVAWCLAQPGRGCCRRCGYDLRGSPGPRCPECGRPFKREAER